MTIEYVGVVALLIGIISLFRDSSFIVCAFFWSTLLGSAAAFVLDSLGGTNISPAHLLLGFLTFRLLGEKHLSALAAQVLSFGRPGFWLLLTVAYSIIGAIALPRLLAGETMIFPLRAQLPFAVPLNPSMSNLTQSIYFTADLICFTVLSAYAASAGGLRVLASAALVGASLNIVFAVLDLITYFTGTTELFAPIRNANYAMLDEAELAGLKRIVGSFTEASSFSSASLVYFAFTGKLWLLGINPRRTLPLALMSLCAVILSTSTTGYVGLVVILCFTYGQVLLTALTRPMTTQTSLFILGAPIAAIVLVLAIALNPDSSAFFANLLDTTIFNKMSTTSGIERSATNLRALQNFFDSFGLGIGNGSLRASSFPVAVLANLGVAGALMFGLFFFTLFFSGRSNRGPGVLDDAYRQAAKLACLAVLVTASTSGALVDLGLPFFIFAAIVAAPQPTVRLETRYVA